MAPDLAFCAVSAGWVELWVAKDASGFVGGEFEVGEAVVDRDAHQLPDQVVFPTEAVP